MKMADVIGCALGLVLFVVIFGFANAQEDVKRDWGVSDEIVVESIRSHPKEVFVWMTERTTDEQFLELRGLLAPSVAEKEARDPGMLAIEYERAIEAMEKVGLDTSGVRLELERLREKLGAEVEAVELVEEVVLEKGR